MTILSDIKNAILKKDQNEEMVVKTSEELAVVEKEEIVVVPKTHENKKVRVAINGFGRIGRAFVRQAMEEQNAPHIEIVAINDLGNIENLAYLLKYDTVYKQAPFEIEVLDKGVQADPKKPEIKAVPGKLKIGNGEVVFVSEKVPENLPWKNLNVDVVIESTGLFTKFGDAAVHIKAGAKKVVISAPAKDDPAGPGQGTVLLGINDKNLSEMTVTSNASCTTNAASPLIAILDEKFGIDKALLSTTHGYTASQALVDAPNKKDFREGACCCTKYSTVYNRSGYCSYKSFSKINRIVRWYFTSCPSTCWFYSRCNFYF
jgi:glyceraldehyde-3-phosphate dehydrogenase type I